MAKAKKLPSGNWRVRVYSHTDKDGKKIYESFSAPSKQEAEMMAAKFANRKTRIINNDLTVSEALNSYITAKEGVLSPSTIRAYRTMQYNHFEMINRIRVQKLTQNEVQLWISDLAKEKSPKTVKNSYALLSSAVRFSQPDIRFDGITLPTIPKRRSPAPSDRDIATLYRESPQKIKIAIALAAFASLRRGEVCAAKFGDIHGNKLFVHADIIQTGNGWIYKDYPKTSESMREVYLADELLELIGEGEPEDYIVGLSPAALSGRYERMCKRLGLSIRFHDLRHYYASIGAVLHIPDTYLASFGGWRKGSPVMKEVYQNQITDIADGYARKMSEHFLSVVNE